MPIVLDEISNSRKTPIFGRNLLFLALSLSLRHAYSRFTISQCGFRALFRIRAHLYERVYLNSRAIYSYMYTKGYNIYLRSKTNYDDFPLYVGKSK